MGIISANIRCHIAEIASSSAPYSSKAVYEISVTVLSATTGGVIMIITAALRGATASTSSSGVAVARESRL